MNINDIFTPHRYPRANYVERDEQIDHSGLRDALSDSITHIVGPTDSGRSSLIEHHLSDTFPLVVDGTQATSVEDLFNHLLNSLISNPVPERHEIDETDLQSITSSEQLVRGAIKDRLETGHYTLIFDDFGEMPTDVQEYVASWVESYVDRNVGVAIVASKDNRDAIYQANPGLRDRLRTIQVPEWGTENLKQIGKDGFDTVDTPMKEPTLEPLADLAEGSPTRMHELCLETFIDIATEREYDVGQEYLPSGVK